MKPLLGIVGVEPEVLEQAADVLDYELKDQYGGVNAVGLVLIRTEEELREFEAGSLVLYRKQARRRLDRFEYVHDGERVELVQETLFLGDPGGANGGEAEGALAMPQTQPPSAGSTPARPGDPRVQAEEAATDQP